jgi:hypothetical protein
VEQGWHGTAKHLSWLVGHERRQIIAATMDGYGKGGGSVFVNKTLVDALYKKGFGSDVCHQVLRLNLSLIEASWLEFVFG